jgi:DNA-directed RNA polymerase specialized sigma24 family protein
MVPSRPRNRPTDPHAGCLAILPVIEAHARFAHRHLARYHDREDAVAEIIAVAWSWYIRLVQRGKDPAAFPTALASFAVRHVRSGRRLAGTEPARDALSPLAQQRRGFTISPLPAGSSLDGNVFDEVLHDNTRSPVPDQVWFRLDFPRWLETLSERKRAISWAMVLDARTLDLARQFRLSPGRISQLRREFHPSWQRFHGELPPGVHPTAIAAA